MEQLNEQEIKIDLYARDNAIYTNEKIIHKKELDKVECIIKDRLTQLQTKNSNEDDDRPIHNSILIEGSRGSGKTSFLNSLYKNLKNNYQEYKALEIFPVLDPTLMEEKSHFFITILSLIDNQVRKALNKKDSNDRLSLKRDFDDALDDLARGLPTIDESLAKPNYWDDATQILDKGLKDVLASFQLRTNFIKFLDISLKILNDKKAFVLLIDDVDITFSKTWPILETIRKYLCTDKIIVIVSGNFELFSIAVRKVQWKNFGKALLINEFDKKNQLYTNEELETKQLFENNNRYNICVSELENQYLQKLFKTSNRIKLRTIKDVLDDGNCNLSILNEKGEDFLLSNSMQSIFRIVGMYNPNQVYSFTSFIISSSIRTQINFLQSFCFTKADSIPKIEVKDKKLVLIPFTTDLINNDVSLNTIFNNFQLIISEILKFLINTDSLFECYQLQPITDSYAINASIFSFSYFLSLLIKDHPYLILDYAIRIPYMYNIGMTINSNTVSRTNELKKLIKHAKMYSDSYVRDIACYIISYGWSFKMTYGGTIELTKEVAKKSHIIPFYDFIKKSSLDNYLKQILLLPYSRSYSTESKRGVYTYSIFTLLGAISDIIKMYDIGSPIENILNDLTKEKKYPMINSTIPSSERSDEKEEDDVEIEMTSDDSDSSINKAIINWLSYVKSMDWKISTYIIGKVITRSYNSFENCYSKKFSLAWNMQMFVSNLINSAIIEEAFESQTSDIYNKIHKSNLKSKVTFFDKNLGVFNGLLNDNDEIEKSTQQIMKNDNEDKLPIHKSQYFHLTRFLITCPFLLIYIGDKNIRSKLIDINTVLLKENPNNVFDKEQIQNLVENDVYQTLAEILFKNQNSADGGND